MITSNRRKILMNISLVFVVTLICNVLAQKNSNCLTPNRELGLCIQIQSCEPILAAIRTRNRAAIAYARESQCGIDGSIPLVCCGTQAVYRPDPLEEIFGIFDDLPFRKTPEQEKAELESLIKQNVNTKKLPDRSICGLEKKINRTSENGQADVDEFPWTVLLEYRNTKGGSYAGFRCGGSLINNRYVLTGANCLSNGDFEITNVRLGEWNTKTNSDCEIRSTSTCATPLNVNIKQEIPHPFFNRASGNNNIGLLRLEKDVTFTDYIRPVCLPFQGSSAPSDGSVLSVAGWGTEQNGESSEITKSKANTKLYKKQVCKQAIEIAPYQLCVKDTFGGGSCRGDSGGPLVKAYDDRQANQRQFYQEGILSTCANSGQPVAYTRISRYISWITRTIREE